jgi:DNA-binding MarR family transcriptional regulator
LDPDVRTIEQQVALLLRLADRNRRRSSRLDGTLERSAYLALSRLAADGPLSVNEIADHLRLDASTVTRQVLAMESAGYVTRERDENDGRRVVITMTPEGAAALQATSTARHDVYREIVAGWDAVDRRELGRLLTRLNAALDGR